MKNKVYFFANFGDWNSLPLGGGEVGNRRTLAIFKECGYDIRLIEKYHHINERSFLNKMRIPIKILGTIIKYVSILLAGRRKKAIVHISGFYGNMVYFEMALIMISKLFRYKTVYEMRGGGAENFYNYGNKLYRNCFGTVIKKCDCVFSQGLENYKLINHISPGKDIFYYPNFVMPDFLPSTYPEKQTSSINMLYFGRISETKNIDIILKAMSILHDKYKNTTLSIVGDYVDENYYNSLTKYVTSNGLSSCVSFYPACNHNKLKEYLKDKHFFLFPTTEHREGHSNAMTEAMAWGLIPIATSQGFSKSVVANNELIVNELTSSAFANCVSKIIDSKMINKYSIGVYRRVLENYSSEIVQQKFKNKYDELFDKYEKKCLYG